MLQAMQMSGDIASPEFLTLPACVGILRALVARPHIAQLVRHPVFINEGYS
jgi:hypothetical protein